jgi:hypothetical protein
MPITSPFAKLYTALIAYVQTTIPAIRYISQDYGQLDFYDDTPPVSWPCLLVDINNANYSQGGHNLQLVEASVTLRLAHTSYSDISNLPPAQVLELGLKHLELEQQVITALHNWQPAHEELGSLTMESVASAKRDDNIRERVITLSTSMQYDATVITPSPTPLEVVGNILPDLELPCIDPLCPYGRGINFIRIAGWDTSIDASDPTKPKLNITEIYLQVADGAQSHNDTTIVKASSLLAATPGILTISVAGVQDYPIRLPHITSGNLAEAATLVNIDINIGAQNTNAQMYFTWDGTTATPYFTPLSKNTALFEFNTQCNNLANIANMVLPVQAYYPNGDGTANYDIAISNLVSGSNTTLTYNAYDVQDQLYNHLITDCAIGPLTTDAVVQAIVGNITLPTVSDISDIVIETFKYTITCLNRS